MKTNDANEPRNILEIRIAQHVSRMDRIHSVKLIMLVIIITLLAMFSRVFAQSGLEDQIALARHKTDIRLASFMKDLPKAEKLPGYINTSFKEVGPLVSPDGKTLYFSRQNYPDNTGGIMDNEDIWYSTYNDYTKMWSAPVKMEAPLNNDGPNSINFVSVTGDTVIQANEYRKHGKMRSGISMSVKQNGQWSFPVAIKGDDEINMSDKFDMYVSYNKQVILTSQELGDSYGKRDIYVTLIHPDGSAETLNLGAVINTDEDEASPFLAPDYKTLYFASKGHHGYGGYDIYVSHRLDESWQQWSEPENLGPTVNTDKDEEFFNFTYDGQYAYFSRADSKENSDIYRVSLSNWYKNIVNTENSSVAESGLNINNMKLNYSLNSEYANLDK